MLIGSYIERIERELGLTCTGDGGSCGKTIEWILIKFDAHRRATLEEARALELYLIQKFLDMLNSNQEIRPYLIEYPLSHKFVMISLSFDGPLRRNADGIEFILNGGGSGSYENQHTLTYYVFDPFEFLHHQFHEETFEDAIRFAQDLKLEYPFAHKNTDRETALDASLIPFVNKILTEQKFECWGIGCHDTHISQIKAKFMLVRRVNYADARKLALYVADNLIDHINQNDRLKPYLDESPFPTHRLKFCIDFVDRNHYHFMDGSIESVEVENNEISYFYRVPEPEKGVDEEYWMQRKTLLAKESYEEAKRLAAVRPPTLLSRFIEKAKAIFSRRDGHPGNAERKGKRGDRLDE